MSLSKIYNQFMTLIRNPRFLGPGVNRYLNRLYHTYFQSHDYNTAGVNIFTEDWDNLIILDACRYESLARYTDILPPGSLESRESRGSMSREWVIGNFNQQIHDVVYLSANMFYPILKDKGKIEGELHAFRAAGGSSKEESSESPVSPKKMTRQAKHISKEFPNKRLVVHYIQPHSPYLGPFGRKHFGPEDDIMTVCRSSRPEITPQVVRKSYEENLEIVVKSVRDLLEDLEGKTVISADHGELLGDRTSPIPVKDWGHPFGIYTKELIKVPWYIIESDHRKQVISESPEATNKTGKLAPDNIESRLSRLGYR